MFTAFNQQEVADVSLCARRGMLVIILHSLCVCGLALAHTHQGECICLKHAHLNPHSVTICAPIRTGDLRIQNQSRYYGELIQLLNLGD